MCCEKEVRRDEVRSWLLLGVIVSFDVFYVASTGMIVR